LLLLVDTLSDLPLFEFFLIDPKIFWLFFPKVFFSSVITTILLSRGAINVRSTIDALLSLFKNEPS